MKLSKKAVLALSIDCDRIAKSANVAYFTYDDDCKKDVDYRDRWLKDELRALRDMLNDLDLGSQK